MKAYESISNSQPVNLYQFIRGNKEKNYYFCDADIDIEINGQKWLAETISDTGRHLGENISVTLPSNNPIAMLYRGMPPSQRVEVRIMRVDYIAKEIQVVWIGTIVEAKREDIHQTKLISAGLSSTMDTAGLRLTWGKNCPYTLYDVDCKVNPTKFGIKNLEIVAIDGMSIVVNVPKALPDEWFMAGFIEWVDIDGVREVRAVTTHKGNRISLMGGTQKLSIGLRINVYPGCDGRVQTCKEKFNNVLNFGGIPHMPSKSPYDGSRIF
ncbi:phage BR0599 family protein [Actinobacillus delphinicola]|uniref:Uncharacterized conserved protein n=1 Tax=Actinobacillus delphinicola TaxID=51161 RepID=A0A448TUZ6_9PAST|nr:phage BR0599 family protein [Actinobacillus delphinicola]VEJ09753.1 Uncharacterized conserved protein [Actinobacillus delphinicola]